MTETTAIERSDRSKRRDALRTRTIQDALATVIPEHYLGSPIMTREFLIDKYTETQGREPSEDVKIALGHAAMVLARNEGTEFKLTTKRKITFECNVAGEEEVLQAFENALVNLAASFAMNVSQSQVRTTTTRQNPHDAIFTFPNAKPIKQWERLVNHGYVLSDVSTLLMKAKAAREAILDNSDPSLDRDQIRREIKVYEDELEDFHQKMLFGKGVNNNGH